MSSGLYYYHLSVNRHMYIYIYIKFTKRRVVCGEVLAWIEIPVGGGRGKIPNATPPELILH